MNSLRRYRLAAGLQQHRLAELAGTTQPSINKLETGGRKLTKEWAERLAPHLGVSAQELLFESETPTAPVVGYVGAGTEVIGERDGDPEYVPIPYGARDTVEVVVVRGDSMYPAYRDGDRLIFEAISRPLSEMIGRECIVQLEDGRKFVKTLRLMSGQIVLESFNAPPIFDVIVTAAWPVRWIERR